jgi:hypothetical protein
MRLGKIVLKLRAQNGYFRNFIGGSAELGLALDNAPTCEFAFVIAGAEATAPNVEDVAINQLISERFAVVVLLKNDLAQSDKHGFQAYEKLHDIRADIFRALIGWQLRENESTIYYQGGSLLSVNSTWLWYQFEFEAKTRLSTFTNENNQRLVETTNTNIDETETTMPDEFRSIYANWIVGPSTKLPYTDDAGHPRAWPSMLSYPEIGDITMPDKGDWLDMLKRPEYGAFSNGWTTAFDTYKGD